MHEPNRPGAPVAPGKASVRADALRASVAQQVLVARLKARNRRDLAVDMLERGAHVLWVTCKSWFASGESSSSLPTEDNSKDAHAHRDR